MAKRRRRGGWGIGIGFVAVGGLMYFLLRPKDDVLPFQSLVDAMRGMGFVPLQPANRMAMPGTLVQVLTRDPLFLSTVCTHQGSLGAELAPSQSPTFDLQKRSKFKGSFRLLGGELQQLAPGLELDEVVSVELSLTNVQMLELSDEAVVECLRDRSTDCATALQLRKAAAHEVTMIKAALVADVTYSVSFSTQTEAELVSKKMSDLALSLAASREGETTLRGQSLIWGIRDDVLLGALTIDALPPTGNADERSTLPVESRATVVEPVGFVSLSLEPLQQEKPMACWATTAAMLRSWKVGRTVKVPEFLDSAGPAWRTLYEQDKGLSFAQQGEFARTLGLVEEPPQNFTTKAYGDMLREHGPLWITTGDMVRSHARVLVGVVEGRDEAETFFEYLDPATGQRHYERADQFHQDFEREARRILDIGASVELRKQILHY